MNCGRCDHLATVGTDIRALARELGRLERQLKPLTAEYASLRRGHPRCAACGVLVGAEHNDHELLPEPIRPRARGQKRYDVCPSCYSRLYKAKRSVPQQRAYEKEVSTALGEDDLSYGED